MTITVEAVYENGVFRPKHPLALPEHQPVRLHVETGEDAVQRVRATTGLIACTDDALVERIATDPDLAFGEPETP